MKLEVTDLTFSYDQQIIIKDLSLHVQKGEFVALIGPSGSGKTTLFHCIGGLLMPDRGEIRIDGKVINGQQGWIGYMPQQASLLPWRTVEGNIRLGQELSGQKNNNEIAALLERAGLSETAKKYPHQLSGGMQQRVAFLRTLASGKEILCLDEPFGALDALTRIEMQQWLAEILLQERQTILFITHSVEEALLLADRIYVLSHRPLQVKKEITVTFNREERFSMRSDPAFLSLRSEIEELLM